LWIVGVIVSEIIFTEEYWLWLVSFLLLFLSILSYFISLRKSAFAGIFYVVVLLLMLVTGWLYGGIRNTERYFEKVQTELPRKVLEINFRPVKQLRTTAYYKQFIVHANRINGTEADFNLLLQIHKDSVFHPAFHKEYVYHLRPREWKNLPVAALPFGFDYGKYLKQNGIFYKLVVQRPVEIRETGKTYFEGPGYYRRIIRDRISRTVADTLSFQLLSALLLGERHLLNPEIKQSFIDAGVVHILAISGLHMGILLFFLRIVFRPLRRYRLFYNSAVLAVLWSYASLIGFPPSVTRAVIMFSLFQTAWELKRNVSSYYVLLLAAFVILLYNPNAWKDTGFQLSFGAVFSILTFYPFIKKIYYPGNIVLRYLLDLIYVSVAAQVVLVPLLLLVFHRFSFGFIIANIFIIPMISIVLILGFLMLPVWMAGFSPSWTGHIFDVLISTVVHIIDRIASWQSLVFENIYFSPFRLIAVSLWVYALYLLLRKQHKAVSIAIIWIWAGSIFAVYDTWNRYRQQQVILSLFHFKPVLSIVNGTDLQAMETDTLPGNYFATFIAKKGIKKINEAPFPKSFTVNNRRIIMINNALPDSIIQGRFDVLILHGSPKINLDLWINRIRPKHIITAGNNYNFLKKRWQQTAENNGMVYTDLTRRGYIVLYEKR
jgi:competence protein ComEC